MTFDIEVVLKGRDKAVTEAITIAHGEPANWTDETVRDVLVAILRAIDRAQNPNSTARVTLQGFSWIVEPMEGKVVIAVEIPMGAAVAGPFAIGQPELEAMINRVMRMERRPRGTETVH